MKKTIAILALSLAATAAWGQAKKPTIMVVPSDQFCISRGYALTYNNQGMSTTLPDYRKALQNDSDLKLVISKLSGLMGDRGFPLKDLEQELKRQESVGAELSMMESKSGSAVAESPIDALKRQAKADIIMDLTYEIVRQGPQKYIKFVLNGLDAYTSKNVASAAGTGKPSTAAQPELLLEEAVLAYMDEFNGRLMSHFENMFEQGREIRVRVQMFDPSAVGFDLEEEQPDGDELSEVIERWMELNTVQGRFNVADATENFMDFEQVRIPMVNDKGRAVDARNWVRDLQKFLKSDPYLKESKLYMRGLGEAWLIVGEK